MKPKTFEPLLDVVAGVTLLVVLASIGLNLSRARRPKLWGGFSDGTSSFRGADDAFELSRVVYEQIGISALELG